MVCEVFPIRKNLIRNIVTDPGKSTYNSIKSCEHDVQNQIISLPGLLERLRHIVPGWIGPA